jgi:uncharacterized protein
VVLGLASACAHADVPELRRRVTDLGEMLSPAAVSRIEASLEEFEKRTGAQIAVLTVPSLEGKPLESYTLEVVERWKLGRKGHDDGVLIFASKHDRKTRIEVGYGLEGKLTDAVASRILREQMTPNFRAGNFDAGFSLAVTHVLLTLDGDLPSAGAPSVASSETLLAGLSSGTLCKPMAPLEFRLMFGLIALPIIALFWITGVLGGLGGWFLYLFLIPFCSVFPAVALGLCGGLAVLAAHLILFPVFKLLFGRSTRLKELAQKLSSGESVVVSRQGTRSSSGSSFSRTSSSSSRSSSSSFRGGGGSFGGGGASGSW